MLDFLVTRDADLLVGRNRVDISGIRRERQVCAGLARRIDQVFDQEMGAVGTFGGEHAGQGVQPFARFLGIGVTFHHVHRDSPEDAWSDNHFNGVDEPSAA